MNRNNRDFKIHCIALTKNEADVVGFCLREAAKWADHVYVYDGGSTDGTWEIVQAMADAVIVPWKQDGKVFREGLRAEVFEAFRGGAKAGDWWLQLNVDEFYPEDPREFFRRVPRSHNMVWGLNVEYKITDLDLERIDFDDSFERVMPQLKHFRVDWSEPRAFRHRDGLQWNLNAAWPVHAGLVARERIVFRHYPFRSPQQIQTRLDVRRENRERGFGGWDHAKELSWREKIVPADECRVDDGTLVPDFDPRALPNHLEKPHVRILKRMLHGAGVWP